VETILNDPPIVERSSRLAVPISTPLSFRRRNAPSAQPIDRESAPCHALPAHASIPAPPSENPPARPRPSGVPAPSRPLRALLSCRRLHETVSAFTPAKSYLVNVTLIDRENLADLRSPSIVNQTTPTARQHRTGKEKITALPALVAGALADRQLAANVRLAKMHQIEPPRPADEVNPETGFPEQTVEESSRPNKNTFQRAEITHLYHVSVERGCTNRPAPATRASSAVMTCGPMSIRTVAPRKHANGNRMVYVDGRIVIAYIVPASCPSVKCPAAGPAPHAPSSAAWRGDFHLDKIARPCDCARKESYASDHSPLDVTLPRAAGA